MRVVPAHCMRHNALKHVVYRAERVMMVVTAVKLKFIKLNK